MESRVVVKSESSLVGAGAASSPAQIARELMVAYLDRTAAGPDHAARRYLWTDAFAVQNLLGLAEALGDASYRQLALDLVEQVHGVLGRYRPDDSRSGWLSGLDDALGSAHPTRGGLRIGKKLPERASGEAPDPRLEWDQDGQYFHYLTQWMHALDHATRVTKDVKFNLWARELAEVAFERFSYRETGGGRRMYWKMSTDLSRPLVPSMGHHDALDGYVACAALRATASRWNIRGPGLEAELRGFAEMVDLDQLVTDDALGIGGLLMIACRVSQVPTAREFAGGVLLDAVVEAAIQGLRLYVLRGELRAPADQRLAFRELGLAIGLRGASVASEACSSAGARVSETTRSLLEELASLRSLGSWIADFWLEPRHRDSRSWQEHRDINDVMLATALEPTGVLAL